MKTQFTAIEARIIGSLIEKSITTPDQYPLSLNALVQSCNQKSNRDPVMSLDEASVQTALNDLKRRFLASEASGHGSRVAKYRHRFCNSEFGGLQLSPADLAIVCELLLRGPQTPGELRSHGERLHAFSDIGAVEASLHAMEDREEPLVEKLPREPGKRECRYRHLFSTGSAMDPETPLVAGTRQPHGDEQERLDRLEETVRGLQAEVEQLRALIKGGGA